MKTILITGGAGFIGSHLADKLLKKDFKIIVVDSLNDFYSPEIKQKNINHNLQNENYSFYKTDIENKSDLEEIFKSQKIDIIVHLAARAGVRPSIENPEDYVKTNILGTINILELMKTYKVEKMVFASSSSVYGNCKEKMFTEDLKITEPISPYAATKSACEQFCYTYHKLYGIKIVALRFFTVYGPRQRPDLAIHKFAKLIKQQKPIPVFGDGLTKRDYTYIDDIISGIESAIEYEKTGYEIINLGGGEPVTLNRMIEELEKSLKTKAIINRLPMQKGDVDKTVSDITKAQKLLNYQPKTPFTKGIEKFTDWIEQQNG